jgi:hypothetical protein
MLKPIGLALALVVLPSQATAQVFRTQCVSRGEAEGLMTFALPEVVRSLSVRCAPHLPATAPLVQAGTVMAARYQVEADKAWPVAKSAFDTMSGVKMSPLLGDAATQKLINTTISTGLADKITPERCSGLDRIIDALQPLPTANMAIVAAALVEMGGKSDSPVRICPAPSPTTSAAANGK